MHLSHIALVVEPLLLARRLLDGAALFVQYSEINYICEPRVGPGKSTTLEVVLLCGRLGHRDFHASHSFGLSFADLCR